MLDLRMQKAELSFACERLVMLDMSCFLIIESMAFGDCLQLLPLRTPPLLGEGGVGGGGLDEGERR